MQSANPKSYKLLDPKGCLALADALGDTPETVISVYALRKGLCRAYVDSDPSKFDGAIVQLDFCPAEPEGFGSDPEILWDLLKSVEGWDCVDMATECATALGEIIERETGKSARYYGDVYYALFKPAVIFKNEAVRQLTLDDLELLESAPKDLHGVVNSRRLLSEEIVACAIIPGRVVARASSMRTGHHADIGVFTMKEWRGRGFATAAASIVAQRVQESGRTPVWSAGESNLASLRVAQKLGFTEVARRTYIISPLT